MSIIGPFGLEVQPEDDPDDPMWIVPPSPVDVPVVAGPVKQSRKEDLQVLAFLTTVAATTGTLDPIGVLPGGNPPDRMLRIGGREWGLELTELTTEDVRRDLSVARGVGRELSSELASSEGLTIFSDVA
jgi:hypothetical protein